MADDGRLRIEKFNGTNYAIWRMQIEDLLYLKKLHQPLGGDAKKPEGMSKEDWAVLDRTALGVVRLSLDASVLFNIVDETTTAGLMAALAKLYEKPSASNKVFLMRRLFNLKMKDGGSVAGHLNDFNTTTSQLSSVGIQFDDELRALLVLSSLPESYDGLVTAVSNSSGSSMLRFDDVVGLVLNEEVRRRTRGEASDLEGARVLHVDGRGRRSDGSSDRNREKSRTKKGGIECWKCGQRGHLKRDCTNSRKGENQEESSSVNLCDGHVHDALVMTSQSTEFLV